MFFAATFAAMTGRFIASSIPRILLSVMVVAKFGSIFLSAVVCIAFLGICPAQAQAFSHVVEDVDAIVNTSEELLARSHCEDSNICQAVYALGCIGCQCAVYHNAVLCIFWIGVIVVFGKSAKIGSWKSWGVFVHYIHSEVSKVKVDKIRLCDSSLIVLGAERWGSTTNPQIGVTRSKADLP